MVLIINGEWRNLVMLDFLAVLSLPLLYGYDFILHVCVVPERNLVLHLWLVPNKKLLRRRHLPQVTP